MTIKIEIVSCCDEKGGPMTESCCANPLILSYEAAMKEAGRQYLTTIIKAADGNITKAAKMAGRNRTQMYRAIERVGVEFDRREYRKVKK